MFSAHRSLTKLEPMHRGSPSRSEVALWGAAALFANGSSTDDVFELLERWETTSTAGSLHILGMDARWGMLSVITIDLAEVVHCETLPSIPVAMSVNRVVATRTATDRAIDAGMSLDQARQALRQASNLAPLPLWLFVAGAATCPVALAVIFGGSGVALPLIALAGGLGACLRRGLIGLGGGLLVQDFLAAMIAGLVAGMSAHLLHGTTSLLIAACPCMILLPGPHLLNGALDVIANRLPLGIARLSFAMTVIAALCIGVLAGLALGGEPFPRAGSSVTVPFWIDALAGGAAASCYAIAYATPPRLIAWPGAIGLVGHAMHWLLSVRAHASPAAAAIVASLLVGIVTVPVARHHRLPFACVAFAAVVSMLPGIFIFPAAAGLFAISDQGARASAVLLTGVSANIATSVLVVAALTLGLAVPKAAHDLFRVRARSGERGRRLHPLHHARKG